MNNIKLATLLTEAAELLNINSLSESVNINSNIDEETLKYRRSILSDLADLIREYVSKHKPPIGLRVYSSDISYYINHMDNFIKLRDKDNIHDCDFLENENPKNKEISIAWFDIDKWFYYTHGEETSENYSRQYANEFEKIRSDYLSKLSKVLNKNKHFDKIVDRGDWDNGFIMLKLKI